MLSLPCIVGVRAYQREEVLPEELLARHHAREVAALAKIVRHKRLRRLQALSPAMARNGKVAPGQGSELDGSLSAPVEVGRADPVLGRTDH